MPEIGRFKLIIHSLISVAIIFIAAWIYYNDSPNIVFGFIIAWLYLKELQDSQDRKKLRDLQNYIDENLNKIK